jgi:outer membrane protein assembly factor BamB/tRNA A-37 threonylcarbamoyl transferase component Bud32
MLQNRYEIIEILGVGGMSTVYLVRDRRFAHATKLCAMKEMMDQVLDPGTRRLNLSIFEREANILASLNHPAIPKIYDFFSEKQRIYLVMEYVHGKTLEDFLAETNAFIPQEQVIDWAIQLCDVLIYLHNQQPNPIVFRDMKPANVMLTEDHRLMVIDFGIARIFQAGTKGTMIGTEGYSPPEQYKGLVTPAADIYALGATLHHLLVRRDPRMETPFTFHERPPRSINPAVSPGLEAIVMKALAYDMEDRYNSAAKMKLALLELIQTGQLDSEAMLRFGLGTQVISSAPPLDAAEVAGAHTTQLLWKFACEEEVRSSPYVAGGTVFVGCYDHNLYALDARDGSFLWKFPTEAGISSSPWAEQEMVFIGSEDGNLYAVHTQNGRSTWKFRTAGPIRSSPRLIRSLIVVGSDDSHLYAIDARWGRQVWKCRSWGPIRSSAFLSDEFAYVGCDDGHVYAVDLESGNIRWRTRTDNRVVSSPTCAEGLVFVGSTDYNVYALDAQTGWAVWRHRTNHYVTSSPTYHEGHIYVGSVDGCFYCLEAKSGRRLWTYETEGQITSSPQVVEGLVFFGSIDGHIYALETKKGTLRWRFKTDGPVPSSPFVTQNVVYAGSMDNHVYALET